MKRISLFDQKDLTTKQPCIVHCQPSIGIVHRALSIVNRHRALSIVNRQGALSTVNYRSAIRALLFLLALMTCGEVMAGGGSKYKFKVKSSPSPSGSGQVYVGTSETSSPTYKDEDNATTSETSSATSQNLWLYANPKTGYHFVKWNCDEGMTWSSTTQNGAKFTTTNSEGGKTYTINAYFEGNKYNLYINFSGGTKDGALNWSVAKTESTSLQYGTGNYNGLSWKIPSRTGYNFLGFYDGSSQVYNSEGACTNEGTYWSGSVYVRDGDMSLTTGWQAKTYPITLNGNNGNNGSATATYDGSWSSITHCTRTGYTLNGYFTATSGGTKVADASGNLQASVSGYTDGNAKWTKDGAATLYAQWTPITYSISFSGNGSTSGGPMSNLSMTYDVSKQLTANAYSRTGYTFDGWATSASGAKVYDNQKSVSNLSSTQGATVPLYAHWVANTYYIHFNNSDGGTGTMGNQTLTYDVQTTINTCTFANKYVVTYSDEKGATSPTTADATRTFSGWAETSGGAVKWQPGATIKNLLTSGTKEMYAVWGGAAAVTLPTPTCAGYRFDGWYSGSTKIGDGGASYTPTANITLTAKWTKVWHSQAKAHGSTTNGVYVTVSSTMTYQTLMDQNKWVYGNDQTGNPKELETQTGHMYYWFAYRLGYTLQGWSTSASGSVISVSKPDADNRWVQNAKVTETTTTKSNPQWFAYYPIFTATQYNVTLSGNGGNNGSATATYDGSWSNFSACTKTGYTCTGYFTESSGGTKVADKSGNLQASVSGYTDANSKWVKAGDATLYAQWSVNSYTVTLNDNGGSGGSGSVTATYDAAMPSGKTAPTRDGFTFQGYFDTQAQTGGTKYYNADMTSARTWNKAGNTTLYARWLGYTITFNANGGSGTMESHNTGLTESYTLPANGFTAAASHTVTFNTDGGSTISPASVTGLEFNGWEDHGSIIDQYGDTWTYDKFDAPYYANKHSDIYKAFGYNKLSLVSHYSYYTVHEKKESRVCLGWNRETYPVGGAVSQLSTEIGDTVPLYAQWKGTLTLPTPTKKDNAFKGWYDGETFIGNGGQTIVITRSVTLVAHWTPSYNVHYEGNGATGGSVPDQLMDFDVAYTLPSTGFVREHTVTYTGSGTWTAQTDNVSATFQGWEDLGQYKHTNKDGSTTIFCALPGTGIDSTFDAPRYGTNGGDVRRHADYGAGVYDKDLLYQHYLNNGVKEYWKEGKTNRCPYVAGDPGFYPIKVKDASGDSVLAQVRNMTNIPGHVVTLKAHWKLPKVTLPTATRTGYQFNGWSDGTEVFKGTYEVSKTIQLTSDWTANTYYVVFKGNGATSDTTATQTFTYDKAQNLTANGFERKYTVSYSGNGGSTPSSQTSTYTFAGWKINNTGSVIADKSSQINLTTTNKDTVKMYAQWNSAAITLPSSTRTGYTFAGWKNEAGTIITAASYTPSKTETLTAQWTANKYDIYIDYNGGKKDGKTTYTNSKGLETDKTSYRDLSWARPSLDGYSFMGFYDGDTQIYGADGVAIPGTSYWNSSSQYIGARNMSLTTKWKANTYTVTYDAQGGTVSPASNTVTYDGKYGTLPTPTRNGYRFDGWYSLASGGTVVNSETVVKTPSDHSIYAHWTGVTVSAATISPSVTFSARTETKTTTMTFPVAYAAGDADFNTPTSSDANWIVTGYSYANNVVTVNLSYTATENVTTRTTHTATITLTAKSGNSNTGTVSAVVDMTPEILATPASSYEIQGTAVDLNAVWTSSSNGTKHYSITKFTPDGEVSGATAPTITSDNKLTLGQAGMVYLKMTQDAGTSSRPITQTTCTLSIVRKSNPVSLAATHEMYVGDEWTGVLQHLSSGGTITTTSGADGIVYYDKTTNKILAPNTAAASFTSTTVTITISQAQSFNYNAVGPLTTTVTVKKHIPTFTWGSATLSTNQKVADYFSTNNTDCPITYSSTGTATLCAGSTAHKLSVQAEGAEGPASLTVNQAENYYWAYKTQTYPVNVEKANDHVQFTFNETFLNSIPDALKSEAHWNGWVELAENSGTKQTTGWVIIPFKGIPDKLTFQFGLKSNITFLGDEPDAYIYQSSDGTNWSNSIWESHTKDSEFKDQGPIQLLPTTRYLKLYYYGYNRGQFNKLTVTELQYFRRNGSGTLNFGTNIYKHVSNPQSFVIEHCNAGFVTTVTAPDHFEISRDQNGTYTKTIEYSTISEPKTGGDIMNTFTIYVRYKADETGSGDDPVTHTGNVNVHNNLRGDINVPVTGITAGRMITHFVWKGKTTEEYSEADWNESGWVDNQFELQDANGNPIAGAPITYSQSSNERIAYVYTSTGNFVPYCGGDVTMTASYAGDDTYAPASLTQTVHVAKCDLDVEWEQTFTGYTTNDKGKTTTMTPIAKDYQGTTVLQPTNFTYSSDNTGVVSTSGNVLKVEGEGETNIHAKYTSTFVDTYGRQYNTLDETRLARVRVYGSKCSSYALEMPSTQTFYTGVNKTYPFTGPVKEITFKYRRNSYWRSKGTDIFVYLLDESGNNVGTLFEHGYSGLPQSDETFTKDISTYTNARYLKIDCKNGSYEENEIYISDLYVTQRSYFTSDTEAFTDKGEINIPYSKDITVSYSDVPIVQYSITNKSKAGIKLEPKTPLDVPSNDCGDWGTYTFTLSGTWDRITTIEETITFSTSAGDKIEIPFTVQINAGQIYYFNVEDGNWSDLSKWRLEGGVVPGVLPNASNIIIVYKNLTIDQQAECYSFKIGTHSTTHISGTVTIAPNGGLTVGIGGIEGFDSEDKFRIKSSTEHQGYFRLSPETRDPESALDPMPMPLATMEYATKATLDHGANKDATWQYFGIPVATETMDVDYITWFYRWSEPLGWTGGGNNVGPVSVEAWNGYCVTQYGQPVYEWKGRLLHDDKTFYLTTGGAMEGDNMIANSYPSPIDVKKFTKDDFDETGIQGTFYIFNAGSWNNWKQETDSGKKFADSSTPGSFRAIPILTAKDLDPSFSQTLIAPMQGICVHANVNNAWVKFNYAKHVWAASSDKKSNMNDPMRAPSRVKRVDGQLVVEPESEVADPDTLQRRVRLQVYASNSGADQLYLLQRPEFTMGYDNGYDAPKVMTGGLLNIYTREEEGEMAVSARNNIDSTFIGVQAGEDDVYKLTITSVIGDSMWLKDMSNNVEIPVINGQTYTFNMNSFDQDDERFLLYRNTQKEQPHTPTGNGDLQGSVYIWVDAEYLHIENAAANAAVGLFASDGKMLMSETINRRGELSIKMLTTGMYLVYVDGVPFKFVKK